MHRRREPWGRGRSVRPRHCLLPRSPANHSLAPPPSRLHPLRGTSPLTRPPDTAPVTVVVSEAGYVSDLAMAGCKRSYTEVMLTAACAAIADADNDAIAGADNDVIAGGRPPR